MEGERAEHGIIEYVEENQKTVSESGFNEIDGLVLTQLMFMDLEGIVPELGSGETVTIGEIYSIIDGKGMIDELTEHQQDLLKAMSESGRYRDMEVGNFVQKPANRGVEGFAPLSDEQVALEQFAAMTITMDVDGEPQNVIAVRATDEDIHAWQEDVDMLWVEDTQAMSDTADYLKQVVPSMEGNFYLSAHSKGGPNILSGMMNCNDEIRERIIEGFLYDTPGLTGKNLQHPNYEETMKLFEENIYAPQDSIVGQFFMEEGEEKFVFSSEKGIMEHDPYSWEINEDNTSFIATEQSEMSKFINRWLDNSVSNMTQEEKEVFAGFLKLSISGAYITDDNKNVVDVIDFWKHSGMQIQAVIAVVGVYYNSLSDDEKEAFRNACGCLITEFKMAMNITVSLKTMEWAMQLCITYKQTKENFRQILYILSSRQSVGTYNYELLFSDVLAGMRNYIRLAYNVNLVETVGNSQGITTGTEIIVDTDKLQGYARHLENICNRLKVVDKNIRQLYTKEALIELKNTIASDAMMDYIRRLRQCINYLNETADDFEAVEREIHRI